MGNTFSDFLGAFVGNAVGDIAATLSGVERTPIISEIVGIVIGCVLGIFIPAKMKKEGIWQAIVNILTFNALGLSKKQDNKCDEILSKKMVLTDTEGSVAAA